MSEQKTHAEIIAEMRAPHDEICEKCHEEPNESCPFCGDPDGCNSPDYGRWPGVMTQFADRAEAAHKREIEKLNSVIQATVSHSDAEIDRLRREAKELRKQIGNAYPSSEASPRSGCPGNGAKLREALKEARVAIEAAKKKMAVDNPIILEIIDAALAAPPRNCDVETAEEQIKRFGNFCRMISKDEICDGCPLLPQCSTLEHCTFAWAQMPYKEGEAK